MYGIRVSQFKTLHTNPRFVMLGDSMTTLGEWTELLPSNDVSDRGIIQDTSEGVLSRLDVSAPGDSTVFLMIGANDALEGISTDVTKRNIAAIVHRLSPKHRVYLQSTVLTRFRRANQNILSLDAFEKGLCSSGECQFVDLNRVLTVGGVIDPSLTVDGTHLNGAGYWRWAGLISPLIQTPIITAQR
jgi:lysophospholipase L1-like esterase